MLQKMVDLEVTEEVACKLTLVYDLLRTRLVRLTGHISKPVIPSLGNLQQMRFFNSSG